MWRSRQLIDPLEVLSMPVRHHLLFNAVLQSCETTHFILVVILVVVLTMVSSLKLHNGKSNTLI